MIYAYPKTEKLITHQFFNHQSQNLIWPARSAPKHKFGMWVGAPSRISSKANSSSSTNNI